MNNSREESTTSVIYCNWCGISLSGASVITYLNGNKPCCDLCLMKARSRDRGGKGVSFFGSNGSFYYPDITDIDEIGLSHEEAEGEIVSES